MVGPGETALLLEHDGPGCITHLYCALAFPELTDYRDAILRCYWDGEATPSVEVPLGDFFIVAHARIRLVRSALYCFQLFTMSLTVWLGMGQNTACE